jgi:SAM-dependent methyltransferase
MTVCMPSTSNRKVANSCDATPSTTRKAFAMQNQTGEADSSGEVVGNTTTADGASGIEVPLTQDRFPLDYDPGGAEVRKTYKLRVQNGFYPKYLGGGIVLDIGNKGSDNAEGRTVVPHAIGVDLDYPGYDGITLPFGDETVDAIFSSHCLEHIWFVQRAIRDQFRILKTGGFLIVIVPHQQLYEKRRFLPSIFNPDHKRTFTPSSLLSLFEEVMRPNSFRVRHLADNDLWFNYSLGPEAHSVGCYEIELVLQKISVPVWSLA